jgi:hypothetical protein
MDELYQGFKDFCGGSIRIALTENSSNNEILSRFYSLPAELRANLRLYLTSLPKKRLEQETAGEYLVRYRVTETIVRKAKIQ